MGSRTDGKKHSVIAVASGKGGVGKTWFAITLSQALADRGERVLLFDGDLGLANVDIQLGLMPKHDLGGVISGRLSLSQVVFHYEEGGFDIVSGRSGSGSLANIPVSRLHALSGELESITGAYDRVIIDLGAGVEKNMRRIAKTADRCIVITTDEPTSLTDAYAFIKITHMETPTTDIEIAVNMVASRRDGERTYRTLLKACEGFLKISPELAGVIRRDAKVPDAIRAQLPLLTRAPKSEAGADIDAIARKLMDAQ